MVTKRLRPGTRPNDVAKSTWNKSACDKSPTGAHWFIKGPDGLFCRFCDRPHGKIYPEPKRRKKLQPGEELEDGE